MWITKSVQSLIKPGFTLSGVKLVAALERVVKRSGYPKMITVNNGSGFASKALDAWAYDPAQQPRGAGAQVIDGVQKNRVAQQEIAA